MQNILTPPGPAMLRDLEKVSRAIAGVLPLGRHRRDLPYSIAELSRLLTSERDSRQAYWAAPRLAAAYLYYFLPWNLLRLAWVLPGLELELKAGSRILDLGSGPLTLPLALWLTRPDLRSTPLRFTCSDLSPHPMELGLAVLKALQGPENPWQFQLRRAPLQSMLKMPGGPKGPKGRAPQQDAGQEAEESGKYQLIMAGNVLNEMPPPRRGTLAAGLRSLAGAASRLLDTDGRIFLLEPGTRLGGKLIALFRNGAIAEGLWPLAPCPHAFACPALPKTDEEGRGKAFSGWCHFICLTDNAPPSLQALSKEADLPKSSLSLSCLLLRKARPEELPQQPAYGRPGGQDDEAADSADFDVDAWLDDLDSEDEDFADDALPQGPETRPERSALRIISAPIRLPAKGCSGRYACSDRGLALLLNAAFLPHGAAVEARWPEQDTLDPKTGAIEVTWESPRDAARNPARETPGHRPYKQDPDKDGQNAARKNAAKKNSEGQDTDRQDAKRNWPEPAHKRREKDGTDKKWPAKNDRAGQDKENAQRPATKRPASSGKTDGSRNPGKNRKPEADRKPGSNRNSQARRSSGGKK